MSRRPFLVTTPSDPPVPLLVRVLAVVLVLPFRLAWELISVLLDRVVVPVLELLARAWHHLVMVPLRWLWRYLVEKPARWFWRSVLRPVLLFVWRYLVRLPLTWLWELVVRVARGIWWVLKATAPFWLRLGELFVVLVYDPVVWLLRRLYRYVLRPGWIGAGWVLRQLYLWTLRPIGLALQWIWRHTVVPLGRAVRWAWRHTAVPLGRAIGWVWRNTVVAAGRAVASAGRWLNQAVLRPAGVTVRRILRGY